VADPVDEPEADGATPSSGQIPESSRPPRPLLGSLGSGLRWVVENKGTVGLALSAYLILKVIVVARGSQEAALEIVRSAGVTQVVLGGVVSGLPILAAVALGLSMYRLGRHLHRFHPSPPPWWSDDFSRKEFTKQRVYLAWAVTAVSVVVASAFTPWTVFVPVVAFGIFLGLLEAQRVDREYERATRRKLSRALVVGLWVVVGGMALYGSAFGILYTVWTAHEELQITGRSQPLVGYVIDDHGAWLTVLQSGTREVLKINGGTVSDRQVCHVQARFQSANTSLVQLVFGAHFGTSPRCPRPGD